MIDQHANSTAAEPDLDATVPADAEAALNASLTLEALPGPAWPWLTMPAPPSMLPGAGRPGASSKAAYRQQRRSEWRTWRASLRWRIAAAVAVGALVTGPRLAWSNGAAAAAGVGLALRFRPSAGTRTCWEGARGERRTARLLAPLEHEGSVIFHDLAPPDHGTGTVAGWVAPPQPPNLDHLVIGPTGVFLVDSWRCHSMLRVDPQERLWHRGEPLDAVLQALRRGAREATVALADARAPVRVQPILSVHGASLPWLGELSIGGVVVLRAAELPRALRVPRQALTPEQVDHLAARVRTGFQPAVP